MVINKIGQQHIDYGTNCQDYGIEFDGMKVVCDGCSEGETFGSWGKSVLPSFEK